MDGQNTFHATQMAACQRTVERIIIPRYDTNTTLQVPEALGTLYDVVLNSSMSEPPATFEIHDKSLYTFDELEKTGVFDDLDLAPE